MPSAGEPGGAGEAGKSAEITAMALGGLLLAAAGGAWYVTRGTK
jgi:hypothetical protein